MTTRTEAQTATTRPAARAERPRAALAGLAVLAGACGVVLSACTAQGVDKSELKTAATTTEGRADGLLASWVPDGGTDVRVLQRTTGDERLVTFDYTGALPSSCTRIATPGEPTDAELKASYATDARTKGVRVSDLATTPTLDASWWPQDQAERTSHLCGRWWVSQRDGQVYAFAPDRTAVADQITSGATS